MIKPKSRKHEDRLKALEIWRAGAVNTSERHRLELSLLSADVALLMRERRRPWYKRIFGL